MYISSVKSHAAALQDPYLINAARDLYQTYLGVHESKAKEPIGAVLHLSSYRGKLLFKAEPVLLPEECFVTFQQIQGSVAK
jgi:hypothetical protein